MSDEGCQPVQPAVNWATVQAVPQAVGLLLLPWGRQQSTVTCWCFPRIVSERKGEQPEADLPSAVAFLWQPRLIKEAVAVLICVTALTICTVFEFHMTCGEKLSKLAIYKERSQPPGSSLQLIYSL